MFLFLPQHSFSLHRYGRLFSLLTHYGAVAKPRSVLAGPCIIMSFWCSETLCPFTVVDSVLLSEAGRGSREAGEEQELTALPQSQVALHNLATHLENPAVLRDRNINPLLCKCRLLGLWSSNIRSRARWKVEKKAIEDNFSIKVLGTKYILILAYCPSCWRAI